MEKKAFLIILTVVLLTFGNCSDIPKDSFSITKENAYQLVLNEGQNYINADFDEWKDCNLHSEKPMTVDLKLLLDKKYEEKVKIWVVRIKCDNKILTFVVDDKQSETIGGWCSDEAETDDLDILKELDEAIIRAIMYCNIKEGITGDKYEYRFVYVEEDTSSFQDYNRICDLGFNDNVCEDILPAGRKIMRVVFCNHTEQHQWFEFDTQIVVDGENYAVYGFYRNWP
jgi:hypothetical protein